MSEDSLSKQAKQVSGVLRSLAHPIRLKLLCHLVEDEKTVNELVGLSKASQSNVSQFLGRMRMEGLVDCRRDGAFAFYRIADRRVLKLIQSLKEIYCNE